MITGAEVGARGRRGSDFEERAGLGIAGAESGKLGGSLLWEDDQLLVGRALSARAAVPLPQGAGARIAGGEDIIRGFDVSGSRPRSASLAVPYVE
jgi:hypothetical protein